MKANTKIIALLGAAALLVALVVVASFRVFIQIEQAAEARKHTYLVMDRADDLLIALIDAETGQRGYLLTGDEAFLEPYMAVRSGIRRNLDELRSFASIGAANQHLDTMAPLIDAKLADMSHSIESRRKHDMIAAIADIGTGRGRRMMDSIRTEMDRFVRIEQDALAQRDAEFHSDMRHLFASIVSASLLTLLFALSFAYLIYRETQHRLKNLVHLETRRLLEVQEATNQQLQQSNIALHVSEEKLAVTLHSIGDAVIATDAEGRVTLLNPLAEQLTGWKLAQAAGRPVEEIFHIVSEETRQPSTIPIRETLAQGTTQGLANHTVLIALDGSERAIADSCAPIRDRDARVVGAVLVFRDVTKEYAAQQALRDSAAKLRLFADNVPAMTASWDENLSCSFASKLFAEYFGLGVEDVIGKHIWELLGEEVYRENEGEYARVLQGYPVNFQRTRKLPDGKSRYLEIKLLPHIGDHGKVLGCFAVTTDVTEHKLAEERIQHVADHDSLTGLPNRLLFNDRLEQAISHAKRDSRQFALLYLDLDKFKPVNDTLGHTAGDELLKAVAARIRSQVRESDTVARVGGDEFTVILPDIARREEAEAVARKIVAALAMPFQLGSQKQSVDIGTSIGIALYPTDARNADALVDAADAAMYRAKQAGSTSRLCAA